MAQKRLDDLRMLALFEKKRETPGIGRDFVATARDTLFGGLK
jgi:hypothetical protein